MKTISYIPHAHLAIPGVFWRRIIDNLHHVRGLEPPRDVLGRVCGDSWQHNQYYPHWQIFFGTTKYFSDGQIFLWLAMQGVSGEWYNEVVVKSLLAQICKSEQL